MSALQFAHRADFRDWLKENAETSEGIWLVFGKTKEVVTLSANDALEEALCFGWIDGQMKRIDESQYHKYFARRRTKSVWSEKNKKLIPVLREKGIMTGLGEMAVENAKNNGMWDAPKANSVTEDQMGDFAEKLSAFPAAYQNYQNMSASVQKTYIKRYRSFKNEESRQKDFEKIVDRLNQNLKPM